MPAAQAKTAPTKTTTQAAAKAAPKKPAAKVTAGKRVNAPKKTAPAKAKAKPTPQKSALPTLPRIEVRLDALTDDPNNVRGNAPLSGIEALAANIEAEGLLMPLIVRPLGGKGDSYGVTAGRRRHAALRLLAARGTLSQAEPIACRVVQKSSTSASLSENIHRQAMHPADELEAWRKLVYDEGVTPDQIATRHGTTTKIVAQRLSLARLAPAILDLLRTDVISLDIAMAFTLTDDRAKQVATWKALKKSPYAIGARSVRLALTENEAGPTDKRCRLIDAATYEAEGGTIRGDLFNDDGAGYYQDTQLLDRLVTQKIETEAERLRGEGWSWIEASFDQDYSAGAGMGRSYPQPVELDDETKAELDRLVNEQDALESQIESAADDDDADKHETRLAEVQDRIGEIEDGAKAYTANQKAKGGGFLHVTHGGKLEAELGFFVREKNTKADGGDKPTKDPSELSGALTDKLSGLRRALMAQHFQAHPDAAMLLLGFNIVRLSEGEWNVPFSLRANEQTGPTSRIPEGGFGPIKTLTLPERDRRWTEAEGEAAQFGAWCALPDDERATQLADATAQLLTAQLPEGNYTRPSAELAAARGGFSERAAWTPDETFFTWLTRAQLIGVLADLYDGNQEAAEKEAKNHKGKAALTEYVASQFAKGREVDSPGGAERRASWLPAPFRKADG